MPSMEKLRAYSTIEKHPNCSVNAYSLRIMGAVF